MGWLQRLIAVHSENTGGAVGLCLEVHDLAVSKLVAGLIRHRLADAEVICKRLTQTHLDDKVRDACRARLQRASS